MHIVQRGTANYMHLLKIRKSAISTHPTVQVSGRGGEGLLDGEFQSVESHGEFSS